MDIELQLIRTLRLGVFKKIQVVRVDSQLLVISSDLFRSRVIDRLDLNCPEGSTAQNSTVSSKDKSTENVNKTIIDILGSNYQTGDQEIFKMNLNRLKSITSHYYGGET